jgi:hypothetical protein
MSNFVHWAHPGHFIENDVFALVGALPDVIDSLCRGRRAVSISQDGQVEEPHGLVNECRHNDGVNAQKFVLRQYKARH